MSVLIGNRLPPDERDKLAKKVVKAFRKKGAKKRLKAALVVAQRDIDELNKSRRLLPRSPLLYTPNPGDSW